MVDPAAGAEGAGQQSAARARPDGVIDLGGVEAEPYGSHPGVQPEGLGRRRPGERSWHLGDGSPGR